MIGFELQRAGLAWLLLLAPLALLLGWRALARSRAELLRWVAERQRARFLPGVTGARAHLRVALGAAGIFFLALAALGPVRGHTWRAVSRRGLDLVLCLDTSRSMLAQDLRPSRLERAKREIRGLLDHMQGDRVALIAFSGDARDVAPLTRDRGTLEGLLAFVSPDDNQAGGTDLAAAIEHALALFDGRTGAHEAIVLLTDGEDLAGQAAAQAEEAAKRGIKLFVVGVGTEAGGKIPVVAPDGSSSFLSDPDGGEVVTRLGRASLAALAARTGGEYLSAEEAPTALEDLYRARISRIEGREVEGGERRVPYDRFQWPLALGLACLVLELGLRGRGKRATRPGADLRLAAALLPLALLPVQAPTPSLAEVLRLHRAGELEPAAAAAQAVLANAEALALGEPVRARAHFALGVVASARVLAQPEEAEALRAAAREAFAAARALAGPGELRNDATYDLGVLELLSAEELRAKLPEISGQPPTPPLQAVPGAATPGAATPGGAAPGGAAPPPDPLPEARKAYEAARGWLVERLRLEWHDEDTRANLELVQRRLKELDEIEKKREQEQQQDKDQQQSGDQKPDDEQKDDEKKSDPKQDPDKKDESGKDPEKQDPQDGEPKKPEDQPPSEPKDEEGKPPEPKPGEEQQPPEAGDAPEPKPGEPKEAPSERVLTREEVMQLLDRLADLEKQQKALEAALRARKRAAAKRDW